MTLVLAAKAIKMIKYMWYQVLIGKTEESEGRRKKGVSWPGMVKGSFEKRLTGSEVESQMEISGKNTSVYAKTLKQ